MENTMGEAGNAGMAPAPPDTIEELFTYHPASYAQQVAYGAIRSQAKDLVRCILANCPAGPDRTRAVTKVREAVMFANASIATNNAAADLV